MKRWSLGKIVDLLQALAPLAGLAALFLHAILAPAPPSRVSGDPADNFRSAIEHAALREPDSIHDGLIRVTPDNRDLVWKDGGTTEVRVVAFMTTMAADQYYRSPDGTGRNGTTPPGSPVLWVTMAPELQRFCQRLGVADPGPRIKAWLGLNPATAYDEIVEMWAPVENIFRPCRDSETSDSICDLPSKADPRAPSKVPNYDTFLRKLYESSYQPPSRGGAPWTGLGYTYDYANGEPGIGASEFMLSPDTPYEVTSVQKPSQYCATN